jgi:uncharacterized protein involved in exopolysaccharide biosynthesis
MVSIAPAPSGPYFALRSLSADAQLIQTLSAAQLGRHYLSPGDAAQVKATDLSQATVATYSPEGQIFYISVKWPKLALAPKLANALSTAFMLQERQRLEERYRIVHGGLLAQERHLANLMSLVTGDGTADSWLRAQYAATATGLYQEDANARIEVTSVENSLTLAQPAIGAVALGPKATLNAALGAVLALLVALVFAFVATGTYGQDQAEVRPVLTKVGD